MLRCLRGRHLVTLRRAACLSSERPRCMATRPVEVSSVTEDELHASVEGGASALPHGALGAGAAEMHAYWTERGCSAEVAQQLAHRAGRFGGVWADPPTLSSRCQVLQGMLPLVPLEQLLRRCPDVLTFRSTTLKEKVSVLSAALPRADVLQMVTRSPGCAPPPPRRRGRGKAARHAAAPAPARSCGACAVAPVLRSSRAD